MAISDGECEKPEVTRLSLELQAADGRGVYLDLEKSQSMRRIAEYIADPLQTCSQMQFYRASQAGDLLSSLIKSEIASV